MMDRLPYDYFNREAIYSQKTSFPLNTYWTPIWFHLLSLVNSVYFTVTWWQHCVISSTVVAVKFVWKSASVRSVWVCDPVGARPVSVCLYVCVETSPLNRVPWLESCYSKKKNQGCLSLRVVKWCLDAVLQTNVRLEQYSCRFLYY